MKGMKKKAMAKKKVAKDAGMKAGKPNKGAIMKRLEGKEM